MRVGLPICLCVGQDESCNCLRIAGEFPVRYTDNAQAFRLKIQRTFCIALTLPIMRMAIQFHNQLMLGTIEVHHVCAKRNLSTKLQPAKPSSTQQSPENSLGYR